jgi:hypothetical protein
MPSVRLLFSCLVKDLRRKTLIATGFVFFVLMQTSSAQESQTPQSGEAVDGVEMAITGNGLIKPGVPNLQVMFRNIGDHDVNLNLGTVGGWSPRPCKLDNRDLSCTFNFKFNVSDRSGATRSYTFRGMSYVAGRLDPYVVYLRAHSKYTLELGIDQFYSPATHEYQALVLPPGTYKFSLEFDGRAPGIINLDQPYLAKMTFWKGKLISNSLSIGIARERSRTYRWTRAALAPLATSSVRRRVL